MSGHRKQAEAPTGVSLPITPMLDMAFQLLMFFILTYNASAHEGQINVGLPARDVVQGGPGNAPAVQADDLPVDLDLSLRVHKRLGRPSFTLSEGPVDAPLENLDALKKQLEKVLEARARDIQNKVKGRGAEER